MSLNVDDRCVECGTPIELATDGKPQVHVAACGRLCWNASVKMLARVLERAVRRGPSADLLHTSACPRCGR